MPRRPPHTAPGYDRRAFLGIGGAAMICGVGGRKPPPRPPKEVAEADAFARTLPKPKGARDAVDGLKFTTPEPQPGGQKREFWVQARPAKWDVAPTGRDEWMHHPTRGKRTFTALVYQRYTE